MPSTVDNGCDHSRREGAGRPTLSIATPGRSVNIVKEGHVVISLVP